MRDFQQIYADYYTVVYRYILSLCRDETLAEEVTQEAFFKALKNIGKFRGQCRLEVWLCQIAKNTYYAWYNDNKKITGIEDDTADNTPDLAEAFIQKELSKEALAKLHELNEPYKEVFMLSVFADLSLNEISALFGKSESWARVTLYRAKKKLREMLR